MGRHGPRPLPRDSNGWAPLPETPSRTQSTARSAPERAILTLEHIAKFLSDVLDKELTPNRLRALQRAAPERITTADDLHLTLMALDGRIRRKAPGAARFLWRFPDLSVRRSIEDACSLNLRLGPVQERIERGEQYMQKRGGTTPVVSALARLATTFGNDPTLRAPIQQLRVAYGQTLQGYRYNFGTAIPDTSHEPTTIIDLREPEPADTIEAS